MLVFEEYLDRARADAARLEVAAEQAGLEAPVPTCPEWTVEKLVRHAGSPFQWARANLEAGGEMVAPTALERPPKGPAALAWFRATVDASLAAFGTAGPEAPAWGWGGDHRAAFWARRLAHEVAVHRYDAQVAAGAPQPIAGDLAADGIDELLELLAFHPRGGSAAGTGETIHLHCTDRDGEWLVRRGADGVEVERRHAKGDVAARGPASDLLLVLLSRRPVDALECLGDAEVLERWQRDVSF